MSAAADHAERTPRLIITNLELENFKSYAGAHSIGPFHKSFSSIVGPNGSGKSNVIDAMLFVFGKRAKQLRLNKVSELIHHSDSFPDLDFARVTVHFQMIVDTDLPQGGDGPADASHSAASKSGFVAVEGSAFSVTRFAYRDNSSKYLINDQRSNFTEVTTLLKDKGIDLDHNRFLILQGEVESIALMKPKAQGENDEEGFLEWLEDIIGSNRHNAAIQAASVCVDKLNEDRASQASLVRLAEKARDGLESAKTEAEHFLKIEKDLLLTKARLQLNSQATETEKRAGRQQEVADLLSTVEKERQAIDAIDESTAGIRTAYEKERTAYEALGRRLADTKKDFAVFERKDVKFKEDIKFAKTREKKVEAQLKKDETRLAQLDGSASNLVQEIAEKEGGQTEKLQANLSLEEGKLEALYANIQDAMGPLRRQHDALRKQREPFSAEIAQLQGQLEAKQAEMQRLQEERSAAMRRVEEASQRLQELRQSQAAKQTEQRAHELTVQSLTTKMQSTTAALESLQKTHSMQQRLVAQMVSAAEQKRAAQSESRSRSALLSALMDDAQAKKRVLKGIRGRLGDLGEIAAEYDVAASTAAGAALDYIVVDSSTDAKKAVEYMRMHSLGRATFIMLDEIKNQLPTAAAGNVQRLVDLVEPQSEDLLCAFYHAFGDTVVADTLEAATRLQQQQQQQQQSKRRMRIVTLNGELIDSSGAMSGGGRKARGLIALKMAGKEQKRQGDSKKEEESDQDALALGAASLAGEQEKLSALATQLHTLQGSRQEMESNLREATEAVDLLKIDLSGIASELVECTAVVADFQERQQQKQQQQLQQQQQQSVRLLEKECGTLRSAIAAVEEKASTIDQELSGLDEQMQAVGGIKLQSQKYATESLQNQLDALRESIGRLKAQLRTEEKAREKLLKTIASAQGELAEAQSTIATLADEYKAFEEEAMQIMVAYQEMQKAYEAAGDSLVAAEQEYTKQKSAVSEARGRVVDCEARLSEARAVVAESERRLAHCESELEKLEGRWADLLEQERGGPDAAAGPEALEGECSPMSMREQALALAEPRDLKERIASLEAQSKSMKVHVGAIAEYLKKQRDYLARNAELERLSEQKKQAQAELDAMRKRRLDEFMEGLTIISMKLKEMYQMITLGGDAELELVDSLDPFTEGIVFSVRPPRKTWKNIRNLSGGEKTLASLALVFALHHYKPTPVYVMDEIDAALDFRNVSIVASYIKERTRGDAQFIIISLRNHMFELADRLVGVYKTNNNTKAVTLNPSQGLRMVGSAAVPAAAAAAAPMKVN